MRDYKGCEESMHLDQQYYARVKAVAAFNTYSLCIILFKLSKVIRLLMNLIWNRTKGLSRFLNLESLFFFFSSELFSLFFVIETLRAIILWAIHSLAERQVYKK